MITPPLKFNYLNLKNGSTLDIEGCTLAGPFSGGIAAVEIDYEYVIFIDTLGKQVIDKKFYTTRRGSKELSSYHPSNGCERLGGFVNGKMVIRHFANDGNEVISLIDKKGNILKQKIVNGDIYSIYDSPPFSDFIYKFDCN